MFGNISRTTKINRTTSTKITTRGSIIKILQVVVGKWKYCSSSYK